MRKVDITIEGAPSDVDCASLLIGRALYVNRELRPVDNGDGSVFVRMTCELPPEAELVAFAISDVQARLEEVIESSTGGARRSGTLKP